MDLYVFMDYFVYLLHYLFIVTLLRVWLEILEVIVLNYPLLNSAGWLVVVAIVVVVPTAHLRQSIWLDWYSRWS